MKMKYFNHVMKPSSEVRNMRGWHELSVTYKSLVHSRQWSNRGEYVMVFCNVFQISDSLTVNDKDSLKMSSESKKSLRRSDCEV